MSKIFFLVPDDLRGVGRWSDSPECEFYPRRTPVPKTDKTGDTVAVKRLIVGRMDAHELVIIRVRTFSFIYLFAPLAPVLPFPGRVR